MGYDAAFRGSYLELFLIVVILSSLPLAIIHARQRATDTNSPMLSAPRNYAPSSLPQANPPLAKPRPRRLQSEAAALSARQELGRVIETSIDIICTLDLEGRFIEVSENCLIWGWRPEDCSGRSWFDFMLPEEGDRGRRSYHLGAGQRVVQHHFVSPDGRPSRCSGP